MRSRAQRPSHIPALPPHRPRGAAEPFGPVRIGQQRGDGLCEAINVARRHEHTRPAQRRRQLSPRHRRRSAVRRPSTPAPSRCGAPDSGACQPTVPSPRARGRRGRASRRLAPGPRLDPRRAGQRSLLARQSRDPPPSALPPVSVPAPSAEVRDHVRAAVSPRNGVEDGGSWRLVYGRWFMEAGGWEFRTSCRYVIPRPLRRCAEPDGTLAQTLAGYGPHVHMGRP